MASLSAMQSDKHLAKRTVSWDEVQQLVTALSRALQQKRINLQQIFGVPRGGTLLAVLFSHQLNLPIIHNDALIDKTTLVVDDVINTGDTVKELIEKTNAYGVILFFSEQGDRALAANPRLFTGAKKSTDEWIILPWEKR